MLEPIAQKLGIRWDELPQRPALGVLMGYNAAYYRSAITAHVHTAAWAVNRDLDSEEVQALAELRAEALRVQSLEIYPVFLTTYLLVRRGMTAFRFPFYTPKPSSFSPAAFPRPGAAFLRGTNARLAWHALRIAAYATLSHLAIGPMLFSYAAVNNAAAVARDARLQQYSQDLKEATAQRRTASAAGVQQRTPAQLEALKARVGAESQDQQQARRLPRRADDDDDPFAADDSSPVAPSQRSGPPASAGSTWEQIRRESKPAGDQQPKSTERASWAERRRGSGQTPQDYTYTNPDDGKGQSKEQSQKQFDDMLEKERRGESEPRRKW